MRQCGTIILIAAILGLCFWPWPHAATADDKPYPLTSDQVSVIAGNTQFATELYARLRQKEGNLFFSPASISTALTMTYAGARGATAAEMGSVLHFNMEPVPLHAAMGGLLHQRNANEGISPNYQLYEANALWLQEGFTFREAFLRTVKDNYNAGLNAVDFDNSRVASQTINQWVEQKTNNKIKNLISPEKLDSSTKLVLTNAIYFKGDWQSKFNKSATRVGDFHIPRAQSVQVLFMNKEVQTQDGFGYFEDKTFRGLRMPYKGNDLSMVVFLPNSIDGLTSLEDAMSHDNLKQWLGRLRNEAIEISFPRIKATDEFELGKTLNMMGMHHAFSDDADFSGMTDKEKLQISKVIHQAYVGVDEEGTEAAAATAVAISLGALHGGPHKNIFLADHPFIFLIQDNRTGSILFMGRIVDPSIKLDTIGSGNIATPEDKNNDPILRSQQQMMQISQAIRSLFATAQTDAELTRALLVKVGAFPKDMIKEDANPYDVWDGAVTVDSNVVVIAKTGDGFILNMTRIPQKSCIDLLTTLSQARASMGIMGVSNTIGVVDTSGMPNTALAIQNHCQSTTDTGNTLAFTYKLRP
jgi:serpin B